MSENTQLGCAVTYVVKRELGGFFSKARTTGIFPMEIAMDTSNFADDVEVVEVSESFRVSKFDDGLKDLVQKEVKQRVEGIQPPECVVYLRTFKDKEDFKEEDREQFLNLVDNFAMYHYNYMANKEDGPYQSSFEFKIRLLKILHATKPFEGQAELIHYVKHIPYISISRL